MPTCWCQEEPPIGCPVHPTGPAEPQEGAPFSAAPACPLKQYDHYTICCAFPVSRGSRRTCCAGCADLHAAAGDRLHPGLLHCWYVDHSLVALPEGHKFPRNKHRAIRTALEGEPQFNKLSQFHQSPVVPKQDLLRVHPEDYINRFAAGQLSRKEMRAIGLPCTESMVRRQFHSCGGTLAACKALLAQPELRITGHLAGENGHTLLFEQLSCPGATVLGDPARAGGYPRVCC